MRLSYTTTGSRENWGVRKMPIPVFRPLDAFRTQQHTPTQTSNTKQTKVSLEYLHIYYIRVFRLDSTIEYWMCQSSIKPTNFFKTKIGIDSFPAEYSVVLIAYRVFCELMKETHNKKEKKIEKEWNYFC